VVETLRAMLRRQGKGEHAEGGAGHSPRVHSKVGFLLLAHCRRQWSKLYIHKKYLDLWKKFWP